ncbi:Hpt domain-containing protein [Sulfurimonas aquatica]|uniref:Hpt domain-containing protein n=1 Tax=Sulfurimonas aquatica TaxID=2672570 RepID=A0A975GC94_9BACT|nr:Hpt domain-containing protein [Sulfurimonas aquatica]QSZ41034.1 Hpt domain-containing protein [Sulfurimonas aquatica]
MLIYNYQKEFLGIDERDLRLLGFNNLAQLKTEVSDFADLFVKTPGYIHNFKHVHWIDFITCAESNEESKVIINVNSKNYRSTITITTAYLVDSPSQKAFLINLNNIHELSLDDSKRISGDIVERPQIHNESPKEIFNTPEFEDYAQPQVKSSSLTSDPYEIPLDVDMGSDMDIQDDISLVPEEVKPTRIQEAPQSAKSSDEAQMMDINDLSLDVAMDDFPELEEEKPEVVAPKQPKTRVEVSSETYDNGYIYDPHVASNELGLPIDLIEEFIEDFIAQAKEFKEALYNSLRESDLDNVKILSHKLKGVAANLRIEDAFEVLAIINTNANVTVIKENLDTLYKIIAKLAGESIEVQHVIETDDEPHIDEPEEEINIDTDELTIDFKDEEETIDIVDSKEPEEEIKIDADELTIDFKDEEDLFEKETIDIVDSKESQEEIKIDTDELTIDFKDEEDLLENETIDIVDSEVPQKIDVAELADDVYSDDTPVEIEAEDNLFTDEIVSVEENELLVEEDDNGVEIILTDDSELHTDEDLIEIEEESPEEAIAVDYKKESIANEIGLDLDSFNELLEDYFNEAKEMLQAMQRDLENSEIKAIKQQALKLKGMSDNMRMTSFTTELETLIHSSDEKEISNAISKIDATIAYMKKGA